MSPDEETIVKKAAKKKEKKKKKEPGTINRHKFLKNYVIKVLKVVYGIFFSDIVKILYERTKMRETERYGHQTQERLFTLSELTLKMICLSLVDEAELQRRREEMMKVEDEGEVLSVTVHRTDKLKNDFHILHPLVRVHIVDETTGNYLHKQHM